MEFLRRSHFFCFLLRSTVRVIVLLCLGAALNLSTLSSSTEAAGLTPFRSMGSNSTTGAASVTINRPIGTLANDVMIAAISVRAPTAGIVFTPPAGWTEIRQDLEVGQIAQVVYYKVSTGAGEPASYVFLYNEVRIASGAIASYWNVDTTSPVAADGGQYNAGSTPTAPAINVMVPGTTLVAIFGTQTGTNLSAPPTPVGLPANMTERWREFDINSVQGFDENFASTGSTGPRASGTVTSATMGQMIALRPAAPTQSGTILYPTRNPGSLTDGERVRVDLIKSWGYTVREISAAATPEQISPELAVSDTVYISEEVQSNNVTDNYTASCRGVVNEETALVDDMLIATSTTGAATWNSVVNLPSGHYITQPFTPGNLQLFTTVINNQLQYMNGIAPGATQLAHMPGASGNITLSAHEIGSAMTDASPAAGRRVELPWGASTMNVDDILNLTANGQQMMRRSIEWAMEENRCVDLIKRAFLTDGTPIPDGASLPVGTKIHFLLYADNTHTAGINDLSISDTLDPTFLYTPIASGGTLKVDNSADTGASEADIYTAVSNAANLTEDLVDGSLVAGYTPGTTTISAGTNAGNATLNIAPNKVWAMLFEVTLQP